MRLSPLTSSLLLIGLTSTVAVAQTPQSADVLEFGLDDTLFVADSVAGELFAFDLPDTGAPPAEDQAYNLLDLDSRIEEALGAATRSIRYNDLAVHPVTRDAYVSLIASIDGAEQPAIVSVSRDGTVTALDLASIPSSVFTLQDKVDDSVSFWRDIPAPTLTVTDLDYVNGEVFVSGLSTGEFASTLRRIAYPFTDQASATGLEIYHAAHGQNETRAPIRAMTVVDLEGSPTVVAAYTCTPLVTIPVGDLEDGTNVTGKTIAELGYGNTPLEVLSFSTQNTEGETESYVLVINREMDADLIQMTTLSAAAEGPGITDPIPYLGATTGLETTPLPLSGVLQAADQDNQFIVALRRNMDTGSVDLVSFRKGAFFRLSDFISEFNFPSYEYADNQMAQGTKMFQNMLKVDEGFPDQTR